MNSCGHTTDFYLGKTDLPRAISSKISRGKFIWGFVLPREKFWEGHTTDIGCQGFLAQLNFLEPKFKKVRCAGIYLINKARIDNKARIEWHL